MPERSPSDRSKGLSGLGLEATRPCPDQDDSGRKPFLQNRSVSRDVFAGYGLSDGVGCFSATSLPLE
jgi:hypothetical protein